MISRPRSSMYSRHRSPQSAPRQGQALIIAVLVMLLATLLSTSFLLLVANTGQLANKNAEKDDARLQASLGADSVKKLIAADINSDDWRPEKVASLVGDPADVITSAEMPPAPGDADYDIYWSPLDKAMGWALGAPYTNGATSTLQQKWDDLQTVKRAGGRVFIKYPDPRFSREAPRYLIESRLLDQNNDELVDGGDKKFMLRVTVIGLSTKGDSTWTKQVFYKPTNFNGGTFSFANFTTNWNGDFATSTLTAAIAATATTLPIKMQGLANVNLFAPGRLVMISDGVQNPVTRIVRSVTTTTGTTGTVTLSAAVGTAFAANSTVSLSGGLMSAPTTINATGTTAVPDAALIPTNNSILADPTATTDTTPYGNGFWYNLGMSVRQQGRFGARPPYARSWGAYSTYTGQNALVSAGPVDGAANLQLINATQPNPTPYPFAFNAPADNRFLRVSFTTNGQPRQENYNSISDPLVPTRPLKPATLNFTRYSALAGANGLPSVGQAGYGPGVYIGNPTGREDLERAGGATLDSSQLQRFWQRKSFLAANGANFSDGNIAYTGANGAIAAGTTGRRLCYPRPNLDSYMYPLSSGSLEERGYRGWISPWEFMPRGAQIILSGSTITVVRDPLSDLSPNTPDANKSWQDTSGYTKCYRMVLTDAGNGTATRAVGAPGQAAVFTQTGDFNGVICAQGNLRVRGTWTGATPLTIVSNNNIYIDGDVKAAAGKLALLASKNVVLNPTQFVQHPEGWVDRSIGASALRATSATNVLTVNATDAGQLALGQALRVGTDPQWRIVTGLTATNVLTLNPAPTVPDGDVSLHLMCDPEIVRLRQIPATATDPANVAPIPTPIPPAIYPAPNPVTDAATRWVYAWGKGNGSLVRQLPAGANASLVAFQASMQRTDMSFVPERTPEPAPAPSLTYAIKTKDVTADINTSALKRVQGVVLPSQSATPAPPVSDFNEDMRQVNGKTIPSPQATATRDDANLRFLKEKLEERPAPTTDTDGDGDVDDDDVPKKYWNIAYPVPTPTISPSATATPIPGATPTPSPYETMPLRRLSAFSNEATPVTGPTPIAVPLTTSVGFWGAPGADPTFDPFAALGDPLRFSFGSWVGTQSNNAATSGTVRETDSSELLSTIRATAYGLPPRWFSPKTAPGTGEYLFDLQSATANGALISISRDEAGDPNNLLPTFYAAGIVFPSQQLTANATLNPLLSITVQATIFAENGSWFVIPPPQMATTTDVQLNGGTLPIPDAVQYRHPAYHVEVYANIAQGFSPTLDADYDVEPDPDGGTGGAMSTWQDYCARATRTDASSRPQDWETVRYQALPLPANLTPEQRVNLPSSGSVLYTFVN